MIDVSPQAYTPQPSPSSTDNWLDQPCYGIGFLPAFVRAFKKYAVFRGRASRGEFWWFLLGTFIVSVVLQSASMGVGLVSGISMVDYSPPSPPSVIKWVLYVVMHAWQLGILIPSLAVGVRRLHDVNKSGWWYAASYGSGLAAMALQLLMVSSGALALSLFMLGATAILALNIVIIVWLASRTYSFRTKWDPPA